ncbi:unnamed protein product [Alternaria alternata]
MPRAQYTDLRALLQLLDPVPLEVSSLPKRVDTLKERLDQQTPSLPARRAVLNLDARLLPTRALRFDHMRLFDMRQFFRHYLQSTALMSRAHTGMAHYVDNPTDGEFAKVQSGKYKGELVLASDFVWYKHNGSKAPTIGRVVFVGKDFRSEAVASGLGEGIKLSIQPVSIRDRLPDILWQSIDAAPKVAHNKYEIFLVENEPAMIIPESALVRREASVFIDYSYVTARSTGCPTSRKYICRRIVSLNPPTIRDIALSHPHRAELEIDHYGRDKILQMLHGDNKRVVCFPYTAFIDAFGLYRNMYWPTTGVYAQFTFLNEHDRKRRMNVLPITLGPFGAKWEDIVASLVHLTDLETGIDMTLDSGDEVTICAPILAYIGDMPQQQNNAGCKSQNAEFFCRSCLISKDEGDNIRFDIVSNGRYHYEMKHAREEAKSLAAREWQNKFQKLGLADSESPLTTILTPALCMPLAFPGDAAHSEFKGIAKQILTVLFNDVIKPTFHDDFSREFASTSTPPHWPALQNIKKYADLINIAVAAGHEPVNTEGRTSATPQPSSRARRASPLRRVTSDDDRSATPEDRVGETPDPMFGEEEDAYVGGKRIKALAKKTLTPNSHTIVHFPESIAEYASARNVTTWSGEDRHAVAKGEVMKTNHRHACDTLMAFELQRQSTYLALYGSFACADLTFSDVLRSVDDKCPTLFQHLKTGAQIDEIPDIDVDYQTIEPDDKHRNAAVQGRIKPKGAIMQDDLLSVIRPGSLPVDHTVSFGLANFIRVRENKLRKIVGIFTHVRIKTLRLFAVVELADRDFTSQGITEPELNQNIARDPILHSPVFTMTGSRTIVGLPAVDGA